ncbi:hypothetical protein [Halobaculum magnesiiphilum]|uniref:Uncharacterized protein n=1 Tax=Halobaculum magnesiiphilum TaxID=1017351 RepID=A0A8T8W9C4_9EURY|nr:hypothetical protein [Halobaculum magnesiiphilum]QZP36462.1 hypothetical protein K6T50_08990 [Halobaculum magnesiiphilum]
MQRRAAVIYVAFFLVVGAASFSLIATASAPQLSFENPDHELSEGDPLTVDGTEYVVQGISAEMEGGGGGGHGGGGQAELVRSGTLNTTNESARYTVEWANDSTVTYDGQDWTVATDNESESVTLTEVIDRTAILENDSDVENETTTVDGEEYVVERADGNESRELIPVDDYFPEPETREYAVGDELEDIENNTATVASVSSDAATLEYFAPRTTEISVSDAANVTVGSTTYFAHFPNNETMVLTQEFDTYAQYEEETAMQTTMTNGLWGVTIVSGLSAFLLMGMAYLPNRY